MYFSLPRYQRFFPRHKKQVAEDNAICSRSLAGIKGIATSKLTHIPRHVSSGKITHSYRRGRDRRCPVPRYLLRGRGGCFHVIDTGDTDITWEDARETCIGLSDSGWTVDLASLDSRRSSRPSRRRGLQWGQTTGPTATCGWASPVRPGSGPTWTECQYPSTPTCGGKVIRTT
nr:uncharacterized protein LOC113810037 isoform X1 [Penaeus vannamei]